MKAIIFLAAVCSLILTGCADSKPDDSTMAVFIDSTSFKWTPYVLMDGTMSTQRVYDVKVTITPTWGQAFYYSYKSGYRLPLMAGIALIVLGFVSLVFVSNLAIKIGAGVVLIMGGAAMIFVKPGWVRYENDKTILQTDYEASLTKDGSSFAIWEAYYNSNQLIGAASK